GSGVPTLASLAIREIVPADSVSFRTRAESTRGINPRDCVLQIGAEFPSGFPNRERANCVCSKGGSEETPRPNGTFPFVSSCATTATLVPAAHRPRRLQTVPLWLLRPSCDAFPREAQRKLHAEVRALRFQGRSTLKMARSCLRSKCRREASGRPLHAALRMLRG